ncbi:hypothetical protein TNCV_1202991 [Trichonephila clavipes]|nr:hypothetical protein TNCV_1202991 [Trichonephila clavipes]
MVAPLSFCTNGQRRTMIPFLIAEDRITALNISHPFLYYTLDDDPQWLTSMDFPICRRHIKKFFLVRNDLSVRRSYSAVNKYQPTTLACDE